MLSEINETEKDKWWYHLYVEPKKYNKLVNITKKGSKFTEREYKLVVTSEGWGQYRGGVVGGTNYWVWDRL